MPVQSGILYTIDSTTGQATNKPLKGAWINFVQNDVIKVRTQTHSETGAYSVDVPLGKYTVNLAVGNVTVTMRAGQLFELKSGDNASAFQNWLYSTTADVDDTLLNSFKQIANDISDSANRAESAEKGAKQIEVNMQNNSIGDANGKWMKEGAGGLLGLTKDMTLISDTTTKITRTRNSILDVAVFPNDNYYNGVWTGYAPDRFSGLFIDAGQYRSFIVSQAQKKAYEVYTEAVTKKDKNNVLHATTSTPKDTMLVGDGGWMGSTIDMLTSDSDASINMSNRTGVIRGDGTSQTSNVQRWGGGVQVVIGSDSANNKAVYRYQMTEQGVECLFKSKNFHVIHKLYSDKNTTVDSNGFIKKASPIIKLFDDHIEWNQDFKEEPVFEKLGVGVYKISNTNGLARGIVHGDWYIETPKNRNGLPYFMVEWEQDAITDDVVIKVFDRKFDINIGDFINGDPRDIGKDERWIDLRFHEQIYSLTNELPEINVPYRELWGVEPYIPPVVEQIEEDTALLDQRDF